MTSHSLATSALGSLLLLVGVAPSLAHHSFSAEFDINQPVELQGVVIRTEWVNPHAWIFLETSDGQQWAIEGDAPNRLLRSGWTRTRLLPGVAVTARGYRSRAGDNRVGGTTVTLPDGTTLAFLTSALDAGSWPSAPAPGNPMQSAGRWTGRMELLEVEVSQEAGVIRLVTLENNEPRDIANAAGLSCNAIRMDQNGIADIELGEDRNRAALEQMIEMVNLAILARRPVQLKVSEDHCSYVGTVDGIPVINGVRLLAD